MLLGCCQSSETDRDRSGSILSRQGRAEYTREDSSSQMIRSKRALVTMNMSRVSKMFDDVLVNYVSQGG
jgi:hypothetical protein